MQLKLIITITVLVVLPTLTALIARKAVKEDIKKARRETEGRIEEEAWETIGEAKRWIEENGGDSVVEGKNKHTLGELLSLEPTEKEYKDYVSMVGEQVAKQYKDYQFFMYEPDKNDLVSGYLLQFQILGHEAVYEELFTYAMDAGLDMDKIDEYFYEALIAGEVIPIGEGIILEKEGTGISPIKSGDDVRVIISFVTEEYRERQEAKEDEADE